MENNDFFRQYKDILVEGIDKVRKSGFKKLPLFKQMIDTLEVFINKETYGRIVPGNYVLLFLLMMGTRNTKVVDVAIRTMQKLVSYNYIHENEELSVNLYKEEFKEYLLVPPATLKNRSVNQIYLEVLMQLQEKDESIQLLIVKNLSLVVRLFQHSLTGEVIRNVYGFLTEMLVSRPGNIEKTIKSTIIQVVRHILENLREIDFNILHDNDSWSIRKVCQDQLSGIVDQIVLRDAVDKKYGGSAGWRLIPNPEDFDSFELQPVQALNEKNQANGKFGWCTACREPASYYCKTLRIPVCSFACKNRYLSESQSFDKLLQDQARAQEAFLNHSKLILTCLAEQLLHDQQKRRILAIEIVNFVLSEPKRFKSIRNHVKAELSRLFRNCLINIVVESEAFTGCLLCMKKLLNLSTFVSEAELMFEMLAAKLTSIPTSVEYKVQILRCLKDILNGDLVVDLFISLDCEVDRKNSIESIMRSVATVYVGVPIPKDIIFEDDPRVKKLCFEILTEMIVSLGELGKKMDPFNATSHIADKKVLKKEVDQAIVLFNTPDVKPEKAVKRLIQLGAVQEGPDGIARFMHRFMDSLSSVKIGQMIGGHTDLCKEVLPSFNKIIEFPDMEVDSGLRHLLDHFTLPGESQQVDRIIDSFSHIFYRDNQKSVFAEAGAIYSLSFLLMMLQTNLHNPQVHEKMKLADVTKLAKGMNKGADFPQEYLISLYNSVQKSQLGFHEKQKEIDFVEAYKQGGKKLSQLYQKDIDRLVRRVLSQFKMFGQVKDFRPKVACLPLLLDGACRPIIEVLNNSLEKVESKQEVVKLLEEMGALISLCVTHRIKTGQQVLFELLSRRIVDEVLTIKQVVTAEFLLDWTMKYSEWLDKSWKHVFSVISRFSRRKAIVKSKETRKPLLITNEKVALQEGWIDQLVNKSVEMPESCALSLLNGLLEVSREEIRDNEVIFCLQKVGDFVECNLPRTTEIFNSVWPLLRDYYFELGCNPNQKVALFGVDFLKQTITKFMKKKETLGLQKELFKPYEMIFTNTELPSIKEFILGTIASMCTHNSTQLRYGWRVVLSILAASFEDTETPEIKAKSYQALSKLIETNLAQLEEYYIDLTQILVKLTRQKEESQVAGCIAFVRSIIEHYNRKLNIQPKVPNAAIDISFLQATWLPLLGVLSTICGDHRQAVQNEAMSYLFELLMEFGCLFKYEFWKMVFQGVIRPTFDEILYTFQIRGSQSRKESQGWLERSCSKLFESISELISVYYEDFRLFLPDIFRIYENCTQHANELLTRLSINAVSLLIQKVAHKYTEEDWQCFLQFFNRLFRKTTPTELMSLEAWQASKSSQDYNQSDSYATKCLSQLMLLGVVEQILQKFSIHLSEKVLAIVIQHIEFLYGIIKDSYSFSSNFNKQLELRSSLWKEGFISEMKELPGLLRQERESLKCLILVEYYRYQLAQNGQQEKFEQYIRTVLNVLQLYIHKHQELLKQNDNELQRHETEREALNMRFLVRDTVIGQIEENGLNSIVAYRKEFFQAFLDMLRYSSTPKRPCSNCKRCDSCQKSKDIEVEFDETLNKLIVGLFNLKS